MRDAGDFFNDSAQSTVPRVDAAFRTDPGDREFNEDRAVILADGRVCAVADGMGGAKGGEVASQIAVETVTGMFADESLKFDDEGSVASNLQDLCERTNQLILQASQLEPRLLGMGTTLTLAVIGSERFSFVHVGDTRLYLWRAGVLEQVTEDHTRSQQWLNRGLLSAEQAERSVDRSVLVRFLGTVRRLQPEIGVRDTLPADRLLICSDGVHGPLGQQRIGELLSRDLPSRELADELVADAGSSDSGASDNLTALVVTLATD